jgi:arylsulfatase A-like enzyme
MKVTSIFSFALLSSAAVTAQQSKPNILYIMTDQQSYQMLSCAGNGSLKTPAMDKLAERGYRFNKAYCVNPVSVPSRFALLTGHYGSEVGVRHNQAIPDKEKLKSILEQSALGKVFRQGGYETLFGGKIHTPMADNKGTLVERMKNNYGFDYYCEDDAMIMAKQTAEILHKRKKEDKPLLLYVSLMNPHDVNFFWHESILTSPEKPKNLSQREWETSTALATAQKTMPEAEYRKQIPPFPKNFAPVNDEPALDAYQKFTDKERLNYYSWVYHRLTELVDAEINVVLEALDKSVIADNTIIVFTSDHGDMNGSHQLIMKNRFYDESARIPFIFAGPGILKGVTDNETLACNGLDLIPTLCDFAGIAKPQALTGKSLKPIVTGKSKKLEREYLFIENTVGFMVMDGRYKYAKYDGSGNTELLLDTKTDPLETINLAYKQSTKKVKKRLNNELEKWMEGRGLKLDPTVTRLPKEIKKNK